MGGKFEGQDSGVTRAELERLKAEAVERLVEEMSDLDERLTSVEEWRITQEYRVSALEARSAKQESVAEDARKVAHAKDVSDESFKTRVTVWGTVAGLIWPLIAAIIIKFLT